MQPDGTCLAPGAIALRALAELGKFDPHIFKYCLTHVRLCLRKARLYLSIAKMKYWFYRLCTSVSCPSRRSYIAHEMPAPVRVRTPARYEAVVRVKRPRGSRSGATTRQFFALKQLKRHARRQPRTQGFPSASPHAETAGRDARGADQRFAEEGRRPGRFAS